jgi:hypothetical protein
MTTLVSLVLNNADRLPIVGSPIGQATTWYRKYSTGGDGPYDNAQPPPYEKVPSRLTKISDYVWKRSSFSSTTSDNEIPVMEVQAHIDKNLVNDGIQLLKIAADMNNGSTKHSLDLYIMGLDKILASLPGKYPFDVSFPLQKKLN